MTQSAASTKSKLGEPLDQKCNICENPISDSEYVVNWGSCGPCFDADYVKYLKTHGQGHPDAYSC